MAYQQVTLATLQQEVLDRVESVPFWTAGEAVAALNEALRVWNMLTGTWKRRVTVTTVADQPWYNVPGTLTYNIRMDFSSFPMEPSSLFDLDNLKPGWEGQNTSTSGAPTRPQLWAPAGLTLFAIWPADHLGGTTLVIDGVAATPTLSAPADFVDLGQDEHTALLGYAQHYLAFKEGGARFQMTQPLYQGFIQAAGDKNLRLKASTFYRKVMGLDLDRSQRPQRAQPPQAAAPGQGT